ncbi:GNAT family N-acetyltransferase [Paenibacillus sp.]|uniref:GNAT family N-acetyltransferase n=1 Tax=Paenibacillus sp. TaxID=58172 RepID=UPI00281E7194|nr:GNAT family N-acetyltransferase [Paenibacillus sp.]MDR0270689.1 GNAT family N-acetyltransferase [Paenibacillus sp.]
MNSNILAPALQIRNSDCNGDLEAVTQLMRELHYPTTINVMRERIQACESNPKLCTMVAELDGQVIGMIALNQVKSFARSESVTQVSALIVSKEHRGQGIGKRLIRSAEEWSKQQGCQTLFLISGNRIERAPAHAFYEHIGFEKIGYQFVRKLK